MENSCLCYFCPSSICCTARREYNSTTFEPETVCIFLVRNVKFCDASAERTLYKFMDKYANVYYSNQLVLLQCSWCEENTACALWIETITNKNTLHRHKNLQTIFPSHFIAKNLNNLSFVLRWHFGFLPLKNLFVLFYHSKQKQKSIASSNLQHSIR